MTFQTSSSVVDEDEAQDSFMVRARVPLILAFVAVAAGLLSLLFLARPDFPGESSAEAGFARDMAAHHSQATEMAEIVRKGTQDESIYAMASETVVIQQLQIGQIRGWLAVWDLPEEAKDLPMTWMGHPTDGLMPGLASSTQISRLASLPQAEMDVEFLRLMIPHHQAALEMAQAILDRTDLPEVRKLANEIIAGQGPEIQLMQDMLTQRGLPRMPDSAPIAGMMMQDGGTAMQHGGSATQGGGSTSINIELEPGSVARKTLQFAPWTLAVFALAWLAVRVLPWEPFGGGNLPNPIVQGLAVATLLAGAAIQAGFIIGQSSGYGTYAFLGAMTPAICAALIVAAPSLRVSYLAGAATSAGLIALYACLRILAPLDASNAEGSSFAGIASSIFYLIALGACVVLWLQTDDFELNEPELAE